MIVFALPGFLLPDVFRQFAPWIVTLPGILMSGRGLTLPDDFRAVLRRAGVDAIGAISQCRCWRWR
ncbi:hypothetical protein [Pseudogemmobacter bohemicus]|uniref:hypothetical protein n=1 Tax=Pseudogemmobacter bohemicus TaxID=2250708 RepID=UPI0038CD1A4B